MAQLSPTQLAWRRRIESVLRVAGPGLDLMLAAGDRLSRVLVREQPAPALTEDAPQPAALPHGH